MGIKQIIKKNRALYSVLFNIKKAILFVYFKMLKRNYMYRMPRVEALAEYKDKFKGDRCFIVCTGPSLTMEDLKLIENEICFSMNSIVNIFERTTFRPTYYLIQDKEVEAMLRDNILDKMNKGDLGTVFVGTGNAFHMAGNINPSAFKKYYAGKAIHYNLEYVYHIYEQRYNLERIHFDFSDDCTQYVADGLTVTYSAIQLACYMGFKEIYLLGCDANSAGHVDDQPRNEGENLSNFEPMVAHTEAYKVAKQYADSHNIAIYNATRGGCLEVFPRIDLESVINDCCANEKIPIVR